MKNIITPTLRPKRLASRPFWALIFSIFAALIIAILASGIESNGPRSTLALATSRQPEKLTELSFNAPTNLPKSLTAGVGATFSFNITNQESAAVTYEPVVTIIENGRSRIIERAKVSLANGQTRNLLVKFTTPQANTEVQLIVSLPEQHQAIHFRARS